MFAINNDKVDPDITPNQKDVEISTMVQLVEDSAARIDQTIPSIGRIDLPDDADRAWSRRWSLGLDFII